MLFRFVPTASAFILIIQCLLASTSASPGSDKPRPLECRKNQVEVAVKVLNHFNWYGHKLCTQLLHRGRPATVTKTWTNTKVFHTTLAGSTIVTVTKCTLTSSVETTVTLTSTIATLTTVVDKIVTVSLTKVAATVTKEAVLTATAAPITTTITVVARPELSRRDPNPRKFGDFMNPKMLVNMGRELVTTGCKCWLEPIKIVSNTITITTSATSTSLEINTVTSTVPTATLTNVNKIALDVSTIVSSTVLITETDTITLTTTPTVFSTVTLTTTPTATSTVSIPAPTYDKLSIPDSSCTYNRYEDFHAVSNSITYDYAVGVIECQTLCSVNPRCQFYFYIRFDPARARGADYGGCFLDNLPYDQAYLQCGYPTQKSAGFNKIIPVVGKSQEALTGSKVKGVSSYDLQEVSANTLEETSGHTLKKTSGDTLKGTSGDTWKKTSDKVLKEGSSDTLEQASGDTSKKTSDDDLNESSGATLKESLGDTLKGTSGDNPKMTSSDILKKSSDILKKKSSDSLRVTHLKSPSRKHLAIR